jgi:parallel beta-helix repeat protein
VHDNGRPGYINTDQGIYWDKTTGGGNLIANNLVEHNVSCGIQLYPKPSQVTVEENTVVNNGNYGMVLYGTENVVANNIFAYNGEVAGTSQFKIDKSKN